MAQRRRMRRRTFAWYIAFDRRPAISSNRSAARSPLVPDRGPARCPTCAEYLEFRTDRNGRMMEHCACGHRAFVERRTGKRDEPKREEPTQ